MSEDLGVVTGMTGTLVYYKNGKNPKPFANVKVVVEDSSGKKFSGTTNELGEFTLK